MIWLNFIENAFYIEWNMNHLMMIFMSGVLEFFFEHPMIVLTMILIVKSNTDISVKISMSSFYYRFEIWSSNWFHKIDHDRITWNFFSLPNTKWKTGLFVWKKRFLVVKYSANFRSTIKNGIYIYKIECNLEMTVMIIDKVMVKGNDQGSYLDVKCSADFRSVIKMDSPVKNLL